MQLPRSTANFPGLFLPELTIEALASCLEKWRDAHPGMGLLVLLPEREREQVASIQAWCRELDLPMVGAIFPAVLTETGFHAQGCVLICFPQAPACFLVPGLRHAGDVPEEQLFTAVAAARQQAAVSGDVGDAEELFLIFDGMLPNIGQLLNGLFSVFGSELRYAGVNAGSESFVSMPCLFDRQQLIADGVLGILLVDAPKSVLAHGYPVSKALLKATSTTGNAVETIDGRPAMAVYREIIGREFGVELTRENFYTYAVHYPLGVVMALSILVRIPVALGDDGSLVCIGDIPANSQLRVIQAPALEKSGCVGELASQLAHGGPPMLTFYCAGRRMHFADQAAAELTALGLATGQRGVLGALTLGEINSDPDIGFPQFHNAAIVCLG